MSDIFENKGAMAATIVVAAADSLNQGQANYVCGGANDHVEIQAALDALPATGGEVLLLDGTYSLAGAITMDSNQTLRGCGRNTILSATTWTSGIYAAGGAGTELVGITIADLFFEGNNTATDGISFTYVDYSSIINCWIHDCDDNCIILSYSDSNIIIGNKIDGEGGHSTEGIRITLASTRNIISGNDVQGAGDVGIWCNAPFNDVIGNSVHDCMYGIESSNPGNNFVGNICESNSEAGIYAYNGDYTHISGNKCRGNTWAGIWLYSSEYCSIVGNNTQLNGGVGISLSNGSHYNSIVSNYCCENSQTTDNAQDNILLAASDYNLISGNVCRRGGLANKTRYGINISNATCDKNIVQGNDLYQGGSTANLNDVGTRTIVKSDNREIEITQVKDYIYIKNTSGGASATGDVVRHKAVAAGNEFDAPTANGEDSVLGMVAEAIANNASGLVQVGGKTTVLKATNAGGAIVIGDYLCTENGVRARLAAGGDMAFARALEDCDAVNCTIDALIISPMKI